MSSKRRHGLTTSHPMRPELVSNIWCHYCHKRSALNSLLHAFCYLIDITCEGEEAIVYNTRQASCLQSTKSVYFRHASDCTACWWPYRSCTRIMMSEFTEFICGSETCLQSDCAENTCRLTVPFFVTLMKNHALCKWSTTICVLHVGAWFCSNFIVRWIGRGGPPELSHAAWQFRLS